MEAALSDACCVCCLARDRWLPAAGGCRLPQTAACSPHTLAAVSPSEVRLIDVIGEGSFACVWRAEWQGTIVAAKLFNYGGSAAATASRQQASVLRSLRAEASLLSALRHPNGALQLVRGTCMLQWHGKAAAAASPVHDAPPAAARPAVCTFLGACEEPPYLLTEFCARKSVDGLLAAGLKDAKAAQRLSWARLLRMALDAGHGMAFLHSRGVVHRDLKSPNLLVDSHWNVKVMPSPLLSRSTACLLACDGWKPCPPRLAHCKCTPPACPSPPPPAEPPSGGGLQPLAVLLLSGGHGPGESLHAPPAEPTVRGAGPCCCAEVPGTEAAIGWAAAALHACAAGADASPLATPPLHPRPAQVAFAGSHDELGRADSCC